MRITAALCLATTAALAACETVPVAELAPTSPMPAGPLFSDYQGAPEIVRRSGAEPTEATGTVFEDLNRNGTQDEGEPGIGGVKVSNGRNVVLSDADGGYVLPALDDMSVMVIQPSGYQVPHDANWVPQFAYQHKPAGSAKPLRFGGLEPTGALPHAINFPLVRAGGADRFNCAIIGDTQTYANQEVGYFRDSAIDDILDRPEAEHPDCIVAVGDVMGDDLSIIPRMSEVISTLKAPQWWVHGNHDLDFDADTDADSSDSWRRLWGANNFAFEVGDVLFISLDNVFYPCGAEDAARPGREFCINGRAKRYNARLTDDQLTFVGDLLQHTDENKLIVVAHHIPFVSFVDQNAAAHQTDNAAALYTLLEGREALSLSGHTHTIENMSPGDHFPGWAELADIERLPFRHIIVGAASGSWYEGDFDTHGVPMALQRMGAPKGWLNIDFNGDQYQETYHGSNVGRERRMWVSVNTPSFRSWYNQILRWRNTPARQRDRIPPLSINDLPDVKILTPRDLSRGTWLTANIWDGSSETVAEVEIDGRVLPMERTQTAQGEDPKVGAEWADPFAVQRQLSVARFALESRSGIARNQGYEAFRGGRYGPAAPQPQRSIADRNIHLWRVQLPEDLSRGVHVATVRSADRHGRVTENRIVLELRDQQPQPRFNRTPFEEIEDRPPLR